jgi:hypothetical protein
LDMTGSCKSGGWFALRRVVVATVLAFTAVLLPLAPTNAGAPIILTFEAFRGLSGLHHSALPRFLAAHIADARLADWRFEPPQRVIAAPNNVESAFRLNPYAGGEVRQLVGEPIAERGFGVHCPVTIEVRLHLNGESQTLVGRQAMMQGGPDDLAFADAIASAPEGLLGPYGAYRDIDIGQRATRSVR